METIHPVRISEQQQAPQQQQQAPQQQQQAQAQAQSQSQHESTVSATEGGISALPQVSHTTVSTSLSATNSSATVLVRPTSVIGANHSSASVIGVSSMYRPTDYNKPSRTPSTLLIETNTQSPSTRFISSAQTALNYRQRYATTTAIDTSVSNTSYQRSADYQRPSHRISLLPPNYAMRPRPNNNFDSMSIASLPPPHLSESGSHTGSASTPSSINASPFSQSVISHPNFNYSQQQRISTTQSIQQPVLSFQQQPVAKKMRFHQSNDDVEVIPLKIDIKEKPGAYNPQVEAISPTLPNDSMFQEDHVFRVTKDNILQQISRVDREISKVESQLNQVKKKQVELTKKANSTIVDIDGKVSLKARINNGTVIGKEVQIIEKRRRQSLAQMIYAENRERARISHEFMENLGGKSTLPLYNQPSDTKAYHENKQKFELIRNKLLVYFRKDRLDQQTRQQLTAQQYGKMMQDWLKKVDKIENLPKRKIKDAKNRDFFEKMFPEIRKQREDKERLSRVGSRIKSEADMEEIMDGLQEQEMEDKKMRSYAVIPPILKDAKDRKFVYNNFNGRIIDMESEYKERQFMNIWTPFEKEYFREKYLQHPKNFPMIASYLERKTVSDCVQYYYKSKKTENYKRLLRKTRQRHRTTRNNTQRATSSGGANNSLATGSSVGVSTTLIDSTLLTNSTGVTTRLQHQKFGPPASLVPAVTITTTSGPPVITAVTTCNTYSDSDVVVTNTTVAAPMTSSTLTITVTATTSIVTSTATICTTSDGVTDTKEIQESSASKPKLQEKIDDSDDETSSFDDIDDKGSNSPTEGSCMICKQDFGHQLASRVVTAKLLKKLNYLQQTDSSNPSLVSASEETNDNQPQQRICVPCFREKINLSVCPLSTCEHHIANKVKKLRALPSKLLASDEITRRRLVSIELPTTITKCCSSCFRMLSAKLESVDEESNNDAEDERENDADDGIENISDDDIQSSSMAVQKEFTVDEIVEVAQLYRQYGPDWKVLSEELKSKYTVNQLKELYNSRREYFDQSGADVNTNVADSLMKDNRVRIANTSTNVIVNLDQSQNAPQADIDFSIGRKRRHSSETISANESIVEDPGLRKDDYDSSATETADETTEQYQNNNIVRVTSPIVMAPALLPTSTSSVTTAVTHAMKQSSPLSVQDIMLNVIEFQLMKNRNDQGGSSHSSEMRPLHPSNMSAQYLQQQTPTISSILKSDDFKIGRGDPKSNSASFVTPMIAATITPIPGPGRATSSPRNNSHIQHYHHPQQLHHQQQLVVRSHEDLMAVQAADQPDPEFLTLDLSVKKPRMDNSISITKNQVPSSTYYSQQSKNVPNIAYNHLRDHRDRDRESSAIYTVNQARIAPKPSHANQSTTVNLKSGGSIILGTPVKNQSQYMRPQKEILPKLAMTGSITQGTPVHHHNLHLQHASIHHLQQSTNSSTTPPPPHALPTHPYLYDYYNNSGQISKQPSALNATQSQQPQHCIMPAHGQQHSISLTSPSSPSSPSQNVPASASVSQPQPQPVTINSNTYRPTYSVEQQLSSRQIILNDYITSQQMLGGLRRPSLACSTLRPAPSPQPTPPSLVQSQQIHQAQTQLQLQQQQRQGVIQRHSRTLTSNNLALPRPPTPHVIYTSGHEAFSSLVDVAAQQPSLPVPQSNSSSRDMNTKSVADYMNEPHRFQPRLNSHQQSQQPSQQRVQLYTQHLASSRPSSTSAASQSVPPSPQPPPPPPSTTQSNVSLTAASLIDAIITHQINLPTPTSGGESSLNRNGDYSLNRHDVQRPSDRLFQSFALAAQDSIPSSSHPSTTTQKSINDEEQKRQIIRMSQKYEPVSPPESTSSAVHNTNYWPTASSASSHISAFDYVKNRIVEVMHTKDDQSTSSTNFAPSSSQFCESSNTADTPEQTGSQNNSESIVATTSRSQ